MNILIKIKKETIVKLWSPLATTATVQIINKRNVLKEYVMTREDCGVFKAVVKGNLDGYRYLFILSPFSHVVVLQCRKLLLP